MESSRREAFLYRGQRVHLETAEVSEGRWAWRYRVEGKLTLDGEGSGVLPDAAAAMDAARDAAIAAVEADYRPYVPSDWGGL